MPANFRIISNNPMTAEKYPSVTEFHPEQDVAGIFATARDEIHMGSRIINHPLSGSVKPNESPYKSLVLSTRKQDLDFDSLRLIEGAREVLDKLPVRNIRYDERMLEDFQVIDLDLLDSAIFALPADYHQ